MAHTESVRAIIYTTAAPHDSPLPDIDINHTPHPTYPSYKSNTARAIAALPPLKTPGPVNPAAHANGVYAGTPRARYPAAGTRTRSDGG